jgi:hypothetical protein
MGSTNIQIENYIRENAQNVDFIGVFNENEMPHIASPGGSIIANYGNNSHWVALINLNAENGSPTMFFDSFGQKPDTENGILGTHARFKSYLDRNSKSYIYNKEELQALDGVVCGHYCTLAVISQSIPQFGRNHNTVWRDYCSKYTTPEKNDEMIRRQIKL